MVWIIGEYAERIDNADELLESFLEVRLVWSGEALRSVGSYGLDKWEYAEYIDNADEPPRELSGGVIRAMIRERKPRHNGSCPGRLLAAAVPSGNSNTD